MDAEVKKPVKKGVPSWQERPDLYGNDVASSGPMKDPAYWDSMTPDYVKKRIAERAAELEAAAKTATSAD